MKVPSSQQLSRKVPNFNWLNLIICCCFVFINFHRRKLDLNIAFDFIIKRASFLFSSFNLIPTTWAKTRRRQSAVTWPSPPLTGPSTTSGTVSPTRSSSTGPTSSSWIADSVGAPSRPRLRIQNAGSCSTIWWQFLLFQLIFKIGLKFFNFRHNYKLAIRVAILV